MAEVREVSGGSFDLPDLLFNLPIRWSVAVGCHNVFDRHGLQCLFPESRGESWVGITDNRGRYSMTCRNRVPE